MLIISISINYHFLKTTTSKPTWLLTQNCRWIRSIQFRTLTIIFSFRNPPSSFSILLLCHSIPKNIIFLQKFTPGHIKEFWGRLLYFSKELTSNRAEQIMKYVTLWISLPHAAKCLWAAHTLFNVALENCCIEFYIGVCVCEKVGLLFLPNQLLGKFPANIWVLRNINCDGSYQYFGILSGLGSCYQQVECIWVFSSAVQTHSWKIQKIETKQNKSPLLESVRAYMRHYHCKSCVWWWNPWTNPEMDALYWSQAGPGHLQHMARRGLRGPCQQQPW